MKRLLVTGASGFLGWNLCKQCPPDWRLTGIYSSRSEGIFPKTEALKTDLTDKDQLWKTIKSVRPDAIFHLAAQSNISTCEKYPQLTSILNVEATAHLAEMCADRHIRLVFTSSEQVFEGNQSSYSETDTPTPKNEYGRQKLAAEESLAAIYPEAAIARIAVLYGKGSPVSMSFLQQWLDAWQKFLPVTAFEDEIRSFMSASAAVDGLFFLLDQDASGIFHIGGEAPMSRYDFAILAKEIFRPPLAAIVKKKQEEVELPAFQPKNLTLDNSKIMSIGYQPRSIKAELMQLSKEIVMDSPTSLN